MLRKLIIGVIVANFAFMLISVITTTGSKFINTADANTTVPYAVSAVVTPQLSLVGTLLRFASTQGSFNWTAGTPASSVDFGTLEPEMNGSQILYMRGQYWYGAVLTASTSGRRYEIKETGAVLSNGAGGSIGNPSSTTEDAYLMVPDYAALDEWYPGAPQGNMQTGGYLGFPARAVSTNYIVYHSEAAGSSRMVRSYMSIRGQPANQQPLFNNQQGTNLNQQGVGPQQNYDPGANGWNTVSPDQPSGSYTGSITYTVVLI